MNKKFSSKARLEKLEDMSYFDEYDLFIIGGGITGAGIALDAATRGMKVALVEMQDFAGGTSSRSTKLVHGGLRYLKQFEVNVVAEVGRERAIVYSNGPHVTTPEWMLLPIHQGGTFGKFTTSIGLRVYDFLAKVKRAERRKMLNAAETLAKEPLIKKEGLKGGGYYVEYRTDDARLTIEVMKAASQAGADIVNYTKAESFLYDSNKKINGIIVRDMISNQSFTIYSKKVVNASGPWVDDVRNKDYSKNNKQLHLTKGVHIVIDQSVFPLKQAVYFDTLDKRMVFAIPRDGKTYVGTTDTFYNQDLLHPRMTTEDRDYLLNAIRYMFPDVKVLSVDVESSWAGVRPLIYEEGKDPSEISRKDEIWQSESGLITIAGGKLTGYRKMAENVVNLINELLNEENGADFGSCRTFYLPISGGNFTNGENYDSFIKRKAKEALVYGLTEAEGLQLAKKYGTNVDQLFGYLKDDVNKDVTPLPPYVYAQLIYSIENEMVVKPVDFFIRRTGSLYFDIEWVKNWKGLVIEKMKEWLEWTPDEEMMMREELEQELKYAVNPQNV